LFEYAFISSFFVIVSVISNDRNHNVFTYTIEPNATYTVENNTAVTLVCPIPTTRDYPSWSGLIAGRISLERYKHDGMSDFMRKQDRLSWARNNRDLVISPVIRADEGMYQCSAAGAGNWFSELLVRGKGGFCLFFFSYLWLTKHSLNHFSSSTVFDINYYYANALKQIRRVGNRIQARWQVANLTQKSFLSMYMRQCFSEFVMVNAHPFIGERIMNI